ncbi:hypothetical protein ODZ84_22180 [Chryseobacterium fluminis]|uniref:hypothetical protein n=1 Tax=Chryseobacterium fluminis TaxID=2983606 RepID=UPI00225AB3B1|nr:hypothetical protein [Chryseobacterium sp. MMS21-Ot14]UZT97845.1 hypothetical protein ODZ84_22180 [Chryseobacterium sp. MMS21-Ot14]
MKKLLTPFRLLALATILALSSCQSEDPEISGQEITEVKTSVNDLRKEITPANQIIPEMVQTQINDSKANLEQYLENDLQIEGISVIGKLSTARGLEITQDLISQKNSFIATGNILDPATVKVGSIINLNPAEELSAAQTELKNLVGREITIDTHVMEISWNHKGEKFSTLCFYNDSGIIWDNVLGGLVMISQRGNVEESPAAQAKVSSKWYKQWWTANWLWGSKRGEIGYKITIYYSGSSVSNVDVSDWGSISLGKAKSESKVTKKTGAYGQCRYALGLCTPTGSLSFNSNNFSISFSGLGSNIVSNGTKSLYP